MSMKHLVIIGAGGFGREMFGAAREAVGFGTEFDIKGFLDDRIDALSGFNGYPPVLSSLAGYRPEPDDVFITALGDIATRRRCAGLIAAKGGRFISVVHRTASLGPNVTVGAGSFVAHNVVLTADVHAGDHVCIFHNTSIGHDTTLGDYAHVYAQCTIGGSVRIGAGAAVYPGARVVPRIEIGEDAVVGIGSVVILGVPAKTTLVGNPAAPARF